MLLQSSEAAQALNVDEKTVLRWIRSDNFPAKRVGGDYRTDPVDLLEWATERGIKVNPALFEMHEEESHPLPPLSLALEAGGIHPRVAGYDKETVLANVVRDLNLPPEVDAAMILDALVAREALATTAVGDGIAIPHLRNPVLVQLPHPKVSLSYLAQPLEFGALDGKPVRLLFAVFTAHIRTHLHLLSELAFCLRDPRLRQVLAGECRPEAVIAAIRQIESELSHPHH